MGESGKSRKSDLQKILIKLIRLASSQILHILYPEMSTATGHSRLFFQAVGDPTGLSQLAPKTQNPHIESSLTKNLGLASSQFLNSFYPWVGSIKGHYRLVRPGRRGSCGTLVIYKRNQQANVQFGLKTKSWTCVIAVLTYIRGNGHINSLVSPLGPGRP